MSFFKSLQFKSLNKRVFVSLALVFFVIAILATFTPLSADAGVSEPKLEITKEVKNLTQGGGYQNSVNANVGDTVKFRIKVEIINQTQSHVVLWDNLPNALSYVPNSMFADGPVENPYDGRIFDFWGIKFLNNDDGGIHHIPPSIKTVTFKATAISVGTHTNKVFTKSNEHVAEDDSASVVVSVSPPPPIPTCTFSSNPSSILPGGSSTLSWTTTEANSVTINKGIGGVSLNGSTSVSPSQTTTYTLTAFGDTHNVTCQATVIVTPLPPPPIPTCTFSSNPSSIAPGGSSTLSWTTTEANSVTINQGIGGVGLNGSTSVSPNQTTTYTLTAFGDTHNVTCQATVIVTQPGSPSCVLNLSPASIVSGSSSTLSWTTTNVASASINQGIGATSLPTGFTTVSPIANTTYTMTAVGNDGSTISCDAALVVTTPAPSCTLTASPSVIISGASSTLTWTTINATSTSIDQGIGAVTPVVGGSTSVSGITTTTTYTLIASGSGGTTTCPAIVTVSSIPLADVLIEKTVTPASAEKGSIFTYTLIYKNTGNLDAASTTIEDIASPSSLVSGYTILTGPDHGTCTTGSNGISCSLGTLPFGESGTITYKVTGIKVGIVNNTATITTTTSETTLTNNTANASISIFTTTTPPCTVNCGGGLNPPKVVLFSKPGDDRPFASQSFIYLSQIPYTGVITNFKGILFVVFLSLWSAAASYFIIRKWNGSNLAVVGGGVSPLSDRSFNIEAKAESIGEIIKERNYNLAPIPKTPERTAVVSTTSYSSKQTSFNGTNLPVEESVQEQTFVRTISESELSEYAKDRGALVSPDALGILCVACATEKKEKREILDSIISSAGAMYPKNDGWIILDKKRLESVMFSNELNIVNVFSNWLADNNSQQVFSFLRILRNQKLSVKSFLKQVAYYIDHLYRYRIGESLDGGEISVDLKNDCTNWSTKDIEQIMAILVNGIDESYSSEDASVKLALVKVLEISEKSMLRGSYYQS